MTAQIRSIMHEVFDDVYNFDIKNLTNLIINDYIIGNKHFRKVLDEIEKIGEENDRIEQWQLEENERAYAEEEAWEMHLERQQLREEQSWDDRDYEAMHWAERDLEMDEEREINGEYEY